MNCVRVILTAPTSLFFEKGNPRPGTGEGERGEIWPRTGIDEVMDLNFVIAFNFFVLQAKIATRRGLFHLFHRLQSKLSLRPLSLATKL